MRGDSSVLYPEGYPIGTTTIVHLKDFESDFEDFLYFRDNFSYPYGLPEFSVLYQSPYLVPTRPTTVASSVELPGGWLGPNYPNPFNTSTAIRYRVPGTGYVRLSIYNEIGQLVHVLHEGIQPFGSYEAVWDGRDLHGAAVGSGVYIYAVLYWGMNGATQVGVRRMTLIR